jgi:Thiol-activated cytolysin
MNHDNGTTSALRLPGGDPGSRPPMPAPRPLPPRPVPPVNDGTPPAPDPGAQLLIYVRSLPKLSYVSAGLDAEPSRQQSMTNHDGTQWTVITTPTRETVDFDDFVCMDTLADSLWPGALVQGASLLSPTPAPITVSRTPLQLVVRGLGPWRAPVSTTVSTPDMGTVAQAVNDLLVGQFGAPQPADISTYQTQVYSEEHLAAKIGASYNALTTKAKASLSASFDETKDNFLLEVNQAYYTIVATPPSSPTGWFGPGVTVAALRPYSGTTNPITYVSSVTYGRRVVLVCSVDKQGRDFDAEMSASWATVDVEGSLKTSSLLNQSTIRAFAIGGAASDAIDLIAGCAAGGAGALVKVVNAYLRAGANWSATSPGSPIGYHVSYLSDNTTARVSLTTDQYNDVDYAPDDRSFSAVEVHFHTKGDDKDDSADINVELLMDNRLVGAAYGVGHGQLWRDYIDQTITVRLSAPIKLNDVLAANAAGDANVNDRRGLWLYVGESRDNTGWQASYDVYALMSDRSKPLLGTSGQPYKLFDGDQPCVLDRVDTSTASKPNNRGSGNDQWVTM